MSSSPAYVSRINQIDAAELDHEIYKVLRSQVSEISKYQPVGKIDQWQPELDAVLKFLVWNFSLRSGRSTFGQELLNLHYSRLEGTKSLLYLAMTVLPGYAEAKLANRAISPANETPFKLKKMLEAGVYVFKAYELFNLLMFLHRGTQPRVIDRLLGISSSPLRVQTPRNIGYSYMTRELLWHGLIEMFTLGLPMINFYYLKETFRRIFRRRKGRRSEKVTRGTVPRMSSATRCGYCEDTPILPVHAGCSHIFCYYCLMARFTAVARLQCPQCDLEVCAENMQRYEAIAALD